jgi:hypothetical protein
MSNDDDIERLLREINATTGSQPSAQPPARRENAEVAKTGSSQAVALVFSAVIGVVGLLLGFLPWVPGIWLGLGGFAGSYLALTVGRRFGG